MGGLFKKPKIDKPKVTRMPDEQDPAVLAEGCRKEGEMRARGGRDSTIMSDALTGSVGKLGA